MELSNHGETLHKQLLTIISITQNGDFNWTKVTIQSLKWKQLNGEIE